MDPGKVLEARKLRDLEKQKEEMAEYEELRKADRERDEEEIKQLRAKREQRKLERVEEEKRMAEQRKVEEARKRTEEDDKKKKKKEEESKKKEERDKKKKDAEERLKPKKPNYVITKKSGEGAEGAKEPTSKEDMQKSKEQLEEEKKAILAQRIQPLDINGWDVEKLKEKANELHAHLRKLAGDKFDHEENYKRQQKDLIELAERARQMSKGKGKKTGSDIQRVDDSFDKLADKYAGCPPKIMLHSKYERLTDHRSYGERRDLYFKIMAELEEAQEADRKVRDHMKELQKLNFKPGQEGEEGEAPAAAVEEAPVEEAPAEEAPAEEAPAEEEVPAVEEAAAEEVECEA